MSRISTGLGVVLLGIGVVFAVAWIGGSQVSRQVRLESTPQTTEAPTTTEPPTTTTEP